MSQLRRLTVWATLSIAALVILFPKVEYYTWFDGRYGDKRGWHEAYPVMVPPQLDRRRLLWELDSHGVNRPNIARMVTEIALTLFIGGGLVLALKPKGQASHESA
jgi:hypothetical protein